MWISTKKKLPRAFRFIVFCLNTEIKTINIGWFQKGKDLTTGRDMWFSDSTGEWFEKNEVLAWFPIPKCKIPYNKTIHRTKTVG